MATKMPSVGNTEVFFGLYISDTGSRYHLGIA